MLIIGYIKEVKMLIKGIDVLNKAMRRRYAVGAFNVYNLESLQAVIKAAEHLRSPVIVQTSESAIFYAGLKTIAEMIEISSESARIPVVLHLDHGRNIALIRKCLELGYTSIMFDGSEFNFHKNLELTKKVVELVHGKGASVEAELGRIYGQEDDIKSENFGYTNPDEAEEFAKKTGIDALAISIGTSHGIYKKRAGRLRFDLLKEIRKKVKIPLVLHGASMVDNIIIKKAKKYGIQVEKSRGIKINDLRNAVRLGISKINVDTDLKIVFTTAMREFMKKHPKDINPRNALAFAMREMQRNVEKHIKIFGSKGKT